MKKIQNYIHGKITSHSKKDLSVIDPSTGEEISKVVFEDKNFAGLHFTGSTNVFRTLWKAIGNNIEKYKSYPRIVGETGGKDFIIAHKSAVASEVATAISRGAFEYQGQNVLLLLVRTFLLIYGKM